MGGAYNQYGTLSVSGILTLACCISLSNSIVVLGYPVPRHATIKNRLPEGPYVFEEAVQHTHCRVGVRNRYIDFNSQTGLRPRGKRQHLSQAKN